MGSEDAVISRNIINRDFANDCLLTDAKSSKKIRDDPPGGTKVPRTAMTTAVIGETYNRLLLIF